MPDNLCKFCFKVTVRHGSPCKKCGTVHPVESPIKRKKVIAEEFETDSDITEDQQEFEDD